MNAPLRRVGVVVFVLFAALFVNLNYHQWWKADDYRNSAYNQRSQLDEYQHPRGKIALSNGEAVALSQDSGGPLYKYLRSYPFKDQYSHVVGYRPLRMQTTSVERMQNPFLTGNADSQATDRLAGLFTGEATRGGNVLLTLSKATQDAAFQQLANNSSGTKKGAVVALDPRTGAVLAEVSMPSFDPNPLVSHDAEAAVAAYQALESDPAGPLRNRATSEILAPGSTMKVIVSAAALSDGLTPDSTIPAGPAYTPPQTTVPIRNAAPGICPGSQTTLKQALTESCNTAFAQLCVAQLGEKKFRDMAEAFGFESEPKFIDDDKNILNVEASQISPPETTLDPPALAQSCIGQRDVRMTPLQGAMVAATVANGGRQMRPYVVDALQNADLTVVDKTQPSQLRRPITDNVADQLRDMMISVVDNGTGKAAKISGVKVGGKTGTAENGEDANDHGWFIGFAVKGGEPVIAVAVLLEGAGKGGSNEATRIAGKVMKAYLDERGNS
jgi:peptidoglycan glycosyltransferase